MASFTPQPGETDPEANFNTQEVRLWNNPQQLNAKDKPLPAHDLNFPLGLTWLDIDRNANIRIKGFTDNVQPSTVKVHLDSWGDTTLYSAGCTWMDIAANDRDFQSGSFSTMDDHPWDKPQTTTSRRIDFAKPYAAPPQVVVWLNELDMDKNHNWRVKAYSSDINNTGFTLHIDTWGDTILYSATTSWISHPSNRTNIASGSYNVMDVRPWNAPQLANGKTINFSKTFERTPKVYSALNTLDIDHGHNLRIKMAQTDITNKGMTWHIDSWADTTLYSAGASYIAVQDY